jgi:CRP-like cAMP-binding protein
MHTLNPTNTDAGRFILELLGMLRFVRITRLVYAMRRAEQNFKYNYNMLVLLKFLIILMMSGHLSGCGLYLIARIHFFDPETTWVGAFVPTLPQQPLARQYVTSVYWGMTTLTTVGYGDLSPVGVWERVFCMLIMIVNLAISAYILGNMTLLATRQDAQTADNRGHLHDLHTFMRMRSIPDALCRHALKHMQLSHVLAKDSDAILDQCPTFIRVNLLRHLYRDAFVKQPLFASARDQFIGQLVSALNVENFFPGDFIFSAGDEPDAFYCIVEGSVEMRPPLSRDHNSTLAPGSTLGPRIASVEPQELEREAQAKTAQSSGGVFRKLGPDMMFGESAVICDFAQPWSARSKTLCRTLQVKRVSWQALATKFPREITRCQQVLLSQIQGELARTGLDESDDGLPVYHDETLMDVLTSVKTGMATHVQDLVTMLCFAASRGDHMEVRRLIKGAGLHPNDGDYDGRAAIHLAAVGGHLETVQFLLEHGGDPSLGDNFGTTPLQESVSRGHTKVSELLRKLGGELLLPNAGGKLCSLAFEAHTKELKSLLQYGVHPDSCDYDFRTPLHLACAEGVLPCVKVLLDFKADVNFKDRWGQTALDEAYAGNHKRIVEYLEGRGGLRGSGSPGQGSTWARSHAKVQPPVSRSNPRSPLPPGKSSSNSVNPQLQDSKERMRRDTVNLAGGNLLEQWL